MPAICAYARLMLPIQTPNPTILNLRRSHENATAILLETPNAASVPLVRWCM